MISVCIENRFLYETILLYRLIMGPLQYPLDKIFLVDYEISTYSIDLKIKYS